MRIEVEVEVDEVAIVARQLVGQVEAVAEIGVAARRALVGAAAGRAIGRDRVGISTVVGAIGDVQRAGKRAVRMAEGQAGADGIVAVGAQVADQAVVDGIEAGGLGGDPADGGEVLAGLQGPVGVQLPVDIGFAHIEHGVIARIDEDVDLARNRVAELDVGLQAGFVLEAELDTLLILRGGGVVGRVVGRAAFEGGVDPAVERDDRHRGLVLGVGEGNGHGDDAQGGHEVAKIHEASSFKGDCLSRQSGDPHTGHRV